MSVAWDWRPETLQQGMLDARKALSFDPNYALAHAWLSNILAWRAATGWSVDVEIERAEAIREADETVRLGFDNAEALWPAQMAYWAGDPLAARSNSMKERLRGKQTFSWRTDGYSARGELPQVLYYLSRAQLALGERTEALTAARDGIDLGRTGGCYYFEAQAQLALAAALMATDGEVPRTEIDAALARAEQQLVEAIEGRALSPQILELRGRLAAACGEAAAASRLLHEALNLYREIGTTGHATRLTRELGA